MLAVTGLMAVALFCFAAGIRELKRKEYIWAVFAFASALVVVATPIQTHAVKFDVPTQMSSTSRP